jgi:hypothetical protein
MTEKRNTKTRELAIATAIALVATSEANTSPGEYNITTDKFDILSLDYKNGKLVPRNETTLTERQRIYKNVGYTGNETITVEGDEKGLNELKNVLTWLESTENKIPYENEYVSATLTPIYNDDGSMYTEIGIAGRGVTYQCEQYSVDTANELKKQGIENIFIAILGKDYGSSYSGHAVIAIQTGEKQDETGQRFPIFALIEPQSLYHKTRPPALVGTVGSGEPITKINTEFEVESIQLIRPENFIDYKGVSGILIPGEDAIFQYTNTPTAYPAKSALYQLKNIKNQLTRENMTKQVEQKELTKEDMNAILMKLGDMK